MIKTEHKIIGTLVPVFSLQSAHLHSNDQGTFAAGMPFIDWLKKTNQSAWQTLPLHETQLEIGSVTKHVPSPYKSYGIGLSPHFLSSAFAAKQATASELERFISSHKSWIEDYVLFCALRDHFGTDDWGTWDDSLQKRDPHVLSTWKKRLKVSIDKHTLVQWQLHMSFQKMREKAAANNILLIGDLPFYVSHNSPLVWAHQDVFQLTGGRMQKVSGIPNTMGTHFGRQIWGHPLYNWENAKQVIAFWKIRLQYQAVLYDTIRFDHAKAFFSYGAMDLVDPAKDTYLDGPGSNAFKELITFCNSHGLQIFAEDSGDRTEALREFLLKEHIAGLRIFWFSLLKGNTNPKYAEIENYPKNCVAYTTTHDTETLRGFLEHIDVSAASSLATSAHVTYSPNTSHLGNALIEKILISPASMVIIPMQDWLFTDERINIPGTEKEKNDTNWQYRIPMMIEDLPAEL